MVTIDARTALACGRQGAAAVANRAAAIETIRAGYQRYSISGYHDHSEVKTTQLQGRYRIDAAPRPTAQPVRGTYIPGPTIVTGHRQRIMHVMMLNPGAAGFEQAIDAQKTLGPPVGERK